MEFKGTKEKWECVFTSDLKRAIRSKRGLLMVFWKPSKYTSQDERYELELKETQANQKLCSKAPEMLEMLKEVVNEKYNFEECSSPGNKIPYSKIIEIQQLIKEATEL